jgi:predicted MFS family arabinose efflux permease
LPLRYLAAAVLARLADEGARVALVLLALEQTASPAYGGALIAAFMLPHVLAAPGVGALADRATSRRLVHALGPLIFAASLAVAALGVGRLPDLVVFGAALLGGCATPLISGALTGLLRDLVPPDRRPHAYGLDVASYNLAGIGGPALAASVAGLSSPVTATLVLAACGVVAAALIATLPLQRRVVQAHSAAGAVWRGVALMWQHRALRAVTLATGIGTFGTGALPLVLGLIAVRDARPWEAGVLLSAEAAGALAGSLLYARRPVGSNRPELVVMAGLAVAAVPLALAAWSSSNVVSVALFALAGLCSGPQTGALFATRDQSAPAELNTQVFALGAGMKISAAALGAALAGQVAALEPRLLLLIVAGAQVIGGVTGLALLRSRATPIAICTGTQSPTH